MKTVHEVSKITGLTIRTLRHYDDIGLLKVQRTGEGISNDRKLYSDEDIEKLFTIMIYKELNIPLKEIKRLMSAPGYDRVSALEEQIIELKKKRRHLSNIITCAEFAYSYGTELLSAEDFSPDGIDKLAKGIRASKEYKTARRRMSKLSEQQLADLSNELTVQLERLVSSAKWDGSYEQIEKDVLDFAKTFASWSDINVSEGLLTSLAFMFFSEDGAFSVAVDEIGGEDTHSSVMMTILLVCTKRWAKSILPKARQVLSNVDDASVLYELWELLKDSFGSELQDSVSLEEFFGYVWVCFAMGMMLLEDEETLNALSLRSSDRLSEAEVKDLQIRMAQQLGIKGIDL